MMTETPIAHPPIVSAEEWEAARQTLLTKEKALTRQHDAVNAERRRLPMVKVEKDYVFEGANGSVRFADLFEGRRQLIVYHFMFDPAWRTGCPGCTSWVNALGDLSMLNDRNTTFALISRAPYEKLAAYQALKGWNTLWYSSFESDFNRDFHVTDDKGESPGLSVFFQMDGEIYHTYSTYHRGVESLTDAYPLLDTTPYGRQEDFEDSPPGWPQKPTYA